MPINRETESKRPGNVNLSRVKLRDICPELTSWKYLFYRYRFRLENGKKPRCFLSDAMYYGDANPAVVISTKPLLVAAYSEDLDCALLVRYPDEFVEKYGLVLKTRLLSVNMHTDETEPEDVVPGPKNTQIWTDFMPRIAEFLSDDLERIDALKRTFAPEIWQRVWECGEEYKRRFPGLARSGNPMRNQGARYR